MDNIKLDGPAENALSTLQDTELNPLEETLFRSWALANQIEKPDTADDKVDYRGIFKATGGKVLPHGQLQQISKKVNSEQTLMKVLKDRMMAQDAKGAEQAKARADKQKQQQMQMKQQSHATEQKVIQSAAAEPGPNTLKSQELDLVGKKLDIEKLLVQREAQKHAPRKQ